MPAKDKILKTFHVTKAQAEYLAQHKDKIGNLSEYIRRLIAADQPDFPDDMPPHGDMQRVPEDRLFRGKK